MSINEKDANQPPFDGKKLFEVQIQTMIMVLAEDESEAVSIARDEAHGLDWHDADYDAGEVSYVVGEWSKSEPYGSKLGLTCDQVMALIDEYEKNRSPTLAELEALGQQVQRNELEKSADGRVLHHAGYPATQTRAASILRQVSRGNYQCGCGRWGLYAVRGGD